MRENYAIANAKKSVMKFRHFRLAINNVSLIVLRAKSIFLKKVLDVSCFVII